MSRMWDAIKQVERQRELPGRQSVPTECKADDRPVAAYVEGVRRRWLERFAFDETQARGPKGGKPLKL